MSEFDRVYEAIKDKNVGFRQETNINGDKYLVFIRPDIENGGTEIVFRKLLSE